MVYKSRTKVASADFIDNIIPKSNYKIYLPHLYDQVQTFINWNCIKLQFLLIADKYWSKMWGNVTV